MRKSIKEPTRENILESLRDDTYGRNEDIANFITELDLIEESMCISLDAKWGEGKTFFVKQTCEVLEYLAWKSRLLSDEVFPDDSRSKYLKNSHIFNSIEIENIFIPIYYNAWMHDNQKDPLMSLILAMTTSREGYFNTTIKERDRKKAIVQLVSMISITYGWVTTNFHKPEDNLDILSKALNEEKIRECVKDIFNDIIVENGSKLVVFIDELDRCRPSFAVEMLERIKHYFEDDRIIFVVSLNKEQLVHTISTYYGEGFDATGYLNKFFDESINLPELSSFEKHLLDCSRSDARENYWLLKIGDGLSNFYRLSLRDKLIYKSHLEEVPKEAVDYKHADGIFLSVFIAVLVILDMIDVNEKKKFLDGTSDYIERVLSEIDEYKQFVRLVSENDNLCSDGSDLVREVYDYTFGGNSDMDFEKVEISKELKVLCIRACNGFRRH